MTSAPQNDLERAIAAATGCGEQNIPFFRQLLKSKLTLLKPRPKDLVPRLKSADANLMEFAVWNSDGRPVLGVPEPSMRFCMEVDWPKRGLDKNGTGSPKAGWFSTLKMLKPIPTDVPRKDWNVR